MEKITFETLPQAVQVLHDKIDHLIGLVSNPEENEEDIILIDGAAKLLRKAKATIYSMTYKNEIPHYKNGARLYFSKKELREFLKSGRVKTEKEIEDGAIEALRKGGRYGR